MGCMASVPADARRRPASIGEVAVFVPGLRLPRTVDFSQLTAAGLPEGLVGRLSALRARIVVLAAQEAIVAIKPRRRRVTRHGGYVFAELRQTLEQYLPVLVGLAEDGSLRDRVKFVWANQEDDAEETAMTNAWYEVLSVLQLMAMLCLSEANMLLLPKTSSDAHQQRISDERKRRSVEIFLKAAGYLDCTIGRVLPLLPCELRSDLPVDLTEEVLRTLCIQALGQGVDVQLGMAIDSPKATLAVKRRLACEMVKYWHQATAYYYHGLMLNEGNSEKSQGTALVALHTAEEIFVESNKACKAFHVAPPKSRNPLLSGSMKYLSEKLPKDTSIKVQINQAPYNHERILETAPALPDFALSLKPDEYSLPTSDSSWKKEDNYQLKT